MTEFGIGKETPEVGCGLDDGRACRVKCQRGVIAPRPANQSKITQKGNADKAD